MNPKKLLALWLAIKKRENARLLAEHTDGNKLENMNEFTQLAALDYILQDALKNFKAQG